MPAIQTVSMPLFLPGCQTTYIAPVWRFATLFAVPDFVEVVFV